MKSQIQELRTQYATYTVHIEEVDPARPYAVFLHGGPGFNSYGERLTLGPIFRQGGLNFLWFDHMGCADSPVVSSDKITWDNHINEIVAVIRNFSKRPVHLIGHCIGANYTHDIVKNHRDVVNKVVWYSPALSIGDVFKGVVRRGLSEGMYKLSDLNAQEAAALQRFQETPDERFSMNELMVLLMVLGKMSNFQDLYWENKKAMHTYLEWMAQRPFNIETFLKIMESFFARGTTPIPSYAGIPVLALYSDNDKVTPWNMHGNEIIKAIPHAQTTLVLGACHWMHFEKTDQVAQLTLDFL